MKILIFSFLIYFIAGFIFAKMIQKQHLKRLEMAEQLTESTRKFLGSEFHKRSS